MITMNSCSSLKCLMTEYGCMETLIHIVHHQELCALEASDASFNNFKCFHMNFPLLWSKISLKRFVY